MTVATLSCVTTLPAFAGKPEPLDKEFLDYLAACEGKDDNWTVVAGKQKRKTADKSQAAAPSSPAPAEKTAPKAGSKP